MNGLLPVALTCIGLLSLHLSPCGAMPYRDKELHDTSPNREPPDKSLTDGNKKMDFLVRILKARSAFLSGLSKNEVKSDPLGGRRHSADFAKPDVLLLAKSPSSTSLSYPVHSRQKRHAHSRTRLPQYMRVGCSLGTCKTQHLNYQLWQLMSKKGQDGSAPFNLNSPDSYG